MCKGPGVRQIPVFLGMRQTLRTRVSSETWKVKLGAGLAEGLEATAKRGSCQALWRTAVPGQPPGIVMNML